MTSKIKDDNQEYEHSFPQVWPDGTEFSVYTTPDNQRTVLQHSSGSHIEFKADGSVFIKAIRDLHLNSSVNSAPGGGTGNAGSSTSESESTTIVIDTDLNLVVKGAFNVEAKSYDLEALDSISMIASKDFRIKGNNTILKADEQLSIEPVKSLYIDTKELRERVTARQSEVGTMEDGVKGGVHTIKVMGNAVIENQDPKGGITIKSAGYLNLVAGAERVDITGDPVAAVSPSFVPSVHAKATYTHLIKENPGPNPRGIPGSAWFEVGPGGYTQNIIGPTNRSQTGISNHMYTGPFTEVYSSFKNKTVLGYERVNIVGIYEVFAKVIFLN